MIDIPFLRPGWKQQDGLAVRLHQHGLETVFTIAARALIRWLILHALLQLVSFLGMAIGPQPISKRRVIVWKM